MIFIWWQRQSAVAFRILFRTLNVLHFKKHLSEFFIMGKKNKGGGKKRGRIHKHRYKKNKQQSPRKGRKALLGEVAEETNTCPTTVENKALPEPSCSRTTLEMDVSIELQLIHYY